MGEERGDALRTGGTETYPLSEEQLGCWLARTPGEVGAHHYLEWRLPHVDMDRLRRAWRKLITRHDALRVVVSRDGHQTVLAAGRPPEISVLDLRDREVRAAIRAARAQRALWSHRRPFGDGEAPAALGVTLLPGDAARLHLVVDRLVVDAWRLNHVLVPDLTRHYAGQDVDVDVLAELGGVSYGELVLAITAYEENDSALRAGSGAREDSAIPPPGLPTRPSATSNHPAEYRRRSHQLGSAAWFRLRGFAGARAITPSTALIAALAEVLRAWSTTETFTVDRLLFGEPATPPGLEVVGNFAVHVSLVVRARHGTFIDRCRSLRRCGGTQGALAVRFVDLSDRQRTATFDRPVHTLSPDPRVWLEVQLSEEQNGILEYAWQWRSDLFPADMVEDMLDAYTRTIRTLAEDETSWSREHFPLLPARQLARREEMNATDAPVPENLLHDAVSDTARSRPDALAVITSSRTLSYRELHSRTNQIGRRLRELGVRCNELVAIVAEKGWEQIVAAHGVLASGAAYLPIDPGVPAQRLQLLLDCGQVEVVLTQSSLVTSLAWPTRPVTRLCVDRDFAGVDDTGFEPAQAPTDLAYVIFTSGSTGIPKGVMVDHRGALNTIRDINGRLGIGPQDRCLAVSGLHFDLSVYDTFGIFDAGGAVVLPDPSPSPDPDGWSRLMDTAGVTFWNSVPALLEMLVTFLELSGAADRISQLRRVILAGDWIPLTLPDRVRAQNPCVQVIASGGPTETCIWSVIYPVGVVDPRWRSIPYGRPLANQRYHVLDKHFQPRPDWVPGEIHISSDVGLAKGYWRDPARTAQQFLTLPGIASPVYASGDIGQYLPDGNIEILGREDFQIKIQGVRIELGEIEAALTEHPAVRSAVIVTTGNARDLPILKAYVACGATKVPAAQLHTFISGKLPAYMVPRIIHVLDDLPLTGNGKVDRLALSSGHTGDEAKPSRTVVAPATAVERRVCELCEELLDVAEVGMSDDIFRLGARLALAVRLVGRIEQELGVRLDVRDIYADGIVADICSMVPAPREPQAAVDAAMRTTDQPDTDSVDRARW